MEDPDSFVWPLEDPLLCVALGFMLKHACRCAEKVHEKHDLGNDKQNEAADWWMESKSCRMECSRMEKVVPAQETVVSKEALWKRPSRNAKSRPCAPEKFAPSAW